MFDIHQVYYGSDTDDFAGLHFSHGAWLAGVDNSQLIVRRGVDDVLADQVRVKFRANPAPKYDSGWQSIGSNSVKTFTHNLGC